MSAIILVFSQKKAFGKYENCFLFHLKSSFHSQDNYVFVFFPFLSTFARSQQWDETAIIMTLWSGFYKWQNVIFGIAQKPVCIKSWKLWRKLSEHVL